MKQKLSLLLAMLTMMSLLCAPMAHAAYLPSIGLDTIEIEDPDVPLVEVPEVRIVVDADKTGKVSVSEKELLDAAKVVGGGEAVRLTIVANGEEVTLPVAGIKAAIEAGAELKVEAPRGQIVMPASALEAYNSDVTLAIKGDTVSGELGLNVYIVCDGKISYAWNRTPIVLYIPVPNDTFVTDNSYSVEQRDENGSKLNDYVGQCMSDGEQQWVVITNNSNYLGYFRALPEVLAENVNAAAPAVVTSPLAARTATPAAPSVWTAVQHWFDSVANQVMKLFGI